MGGPSKTNVHVLLETLRRQGALVTIGADTAVLENKHKRCRQPDCVPALAGMLEFCRQTLQLFLLPAVILSGGAKTLPHKFSHMQKSSFRCPLICRTYLVGCYFWFSQAELAPN